MKGSCLLLTQWLCSAAAAQVLANSGAAISVQNGAQLTVKGAMLISGNGTIDNNGVIDLSGDWTNNAATNCFGNSEGTVVLNGSGQSIQGTMYTQFFHLQLAGGDVTLQQDTYAGGSAATPRTGVIALNDAYLFLNGHLLSTSNPVPGAVTRNTGLLVSETAPPANYGRFNWWMGNAASGDHVVPFGSAVTGEFLPVSMNVTTSSSDPLYSITFATYPTNTLASPNNRPLPAGLTALTDQGGIENAPNVLDRFWSISTGETSDQPTASLAFTYRDSEWNTGTNTIVESALQAQRFDGTQWSNPIIGLVNTLSNTVTTTPINTFDMVWALAASSTPLPVELLFFNAQLEGSAVLCNWSTASEQNNDFFTVERSRDGEYFEPIGQVDGAANSQQTLHYTLTDGTPYFGLSYYRLRQTDLDGTQAWSGIVPVVINATEVPGLMVWPNPCRDLLNIQGLDGSETITVIDATGRRVMSSSGRNTLHTEQLDAGPYTVLVTHDRTMRSARFVKH